MSRARRLTAINPVDHPGGAELALLRLLGPLAQRGWRITLTSPSGGRLRDQAVAAGLRWRRLPLGSLRRRGGVRALCSLPAAAALARTSDVVYLNGAVAARALPACAAARAIPARGRGGGRRRPRIVVHVHDMVERVPEFWRWADVVLADSQAVAGRLIGLDVRVVYCPVDLDPPPAVPPWPHDGAPVVGFVGRIEPRKGVLDLVRAAPLIRRERPDVRVAVVGADPYGSAPAYTQAVLGSAEVEHYPWQDNAPGLMRHLSVLVLPAYAEPFGTVLAEAMAVGTPVVATAVDGLPEVVDDGISGRLVPPGDVKALAHAVLEVLERREAMSAAARERARRFSTEDYVERVEALLSP